METDGIWNGILFDVIGNAIWAAITVSLVGLFLATRDRAKFGGRWRALIRWTPEWAESHLMGYKCPDPHSDGEIALSYGSGPKQNQYWGLGVWRLRDGTDDIAELCVEFRAFELARGWSIWPPLIRHSLRSCFLTSRIRHELGTFKYPTKFASYEVVFSRASDEQLLGTIQARMESSTTSATVGEFRAERIS
jgi:hypothetical protein